MVRVRSVRVGRPIRDSYQIDLIKNKIRDSTPNIDLNKAPRNIPDIAFDKAKELGGKKLETLSISITEIQEDLIPIGNNIYVTPGGAVKPSDCNRWPDSPACGGPGLRFQLNPFAPEISVAMDECNLGINVAHTAGWWALPSFQAVYRKQECIDYKPAENLPPIGGAGAGMPLILPEDLDPNKRYLIAIESSGSSGKYGKLLSLDCAEVNFGIATIEQNFAVRPIYVGQRYPYSKHEPNGIDAKSAIYWIDLYSKSLKKADEGNPLGRIKGTFGASAPVALYSGLWSLLKLFFEGECKVNTWLTSESRNSRAGLIAPTVYRETFNAGGNPPSFIRDTIAKVIDLSTCVEVYPVKILPPPPPPERCECDDMGCCPQPANNNEQLLQLILKRIGPFPTNVQIYDSDENEVEAQQQTRRVSDISEAFRVSVERTEKASKMIGIDDFPITVPKTLMEKPPEGGLLGALWDFITPDETKTIKNLTELSIWQTEQIYDALGSWTQTVEIKDTDATKEGDQTKKLILPNIAETLKEIIIILMQVAKIQGLQLDIDLKTLLEASSTKLAAVKAAVVAADIQQYLDYETTERCTDVEVQVTVPNIIQPDDPGSSTTEDERKKFEDAKEKADEDANDLMKFLQSSTAKVKYDDWDGKHSLQDQLTDLDNAAAMIRAQFFQTE